MKIWVLNYSFIFKIIIMPNDKTDSKGMATTNADQERDMAAKGGPATSLGKPDDKHGISHPYDDDLQAQIAAKGGKKKHDDKTWPKDDQKHK
jgi:hypothetical protein